MLSLLIVAGAFILFYICQKVWVFDSRPRLPPLAFSFPLVGSPYLWTNDPRKVLRKLWHRYGPIFRIHTGNDVAFVLNGARAIKEAVRLYPQILGSAKALPIYTDLHNFPAGEWGSHWRRGGMVQAAGDPHIFLSPPSQGFPGSSS